MVRKARKKLTTAMQKDLITALKMCAVKRNIMIADIIEQAVVEHLKSHCSEYLKADIMQEATEHDDKD